MKLFAHNKDWQYKIIKRSKYFDKKWYLETYPEVSESKTDPVEHYLNIGWKEKYNPSIKFDGNAYLVENPDVKEANMNPLLHYERFGKKEGREKTSVNVYRTKPIYKSKIILNYFLRFITNLLYMKTIKNNHKARICVIIHLYYTSLWPEIKEYLKNLKNYEYDLIITHTKRLPKIVKKDIEKFNPKARLLCPPNKGFDLGPFIYCLRKINLKKYDIIFKLHTKRNIKRSNYYGTFMSGAEWRKFCFEGVLGIVNVHKTIDYLLNNKKIGMVAHKKLITTKDIFTNKIETIRTLCEYNLECPQEYKFIIGTMFAAKASALAQIRKTFSIHCFDDSERGVFTKAHCVERILSLNILSKNLQIKGNNSFHLLTLWHNILSVFYPYKPLNLIDLHIIRSTTWYKGSIGSKYCYLSSHMFNKNPELFNKLAKIYNINKKTDVINKTSVEHNIFMTNFITKNLIAQINSPLEQTDFTIYGDKIAVEKTVKKHSYPLLKNKSTPAVFLYDNGRYFNDDIDQLITTKQTKLLIQTLYKYIRYVFKYFEISKNKNILNKQAFDAIPRNTYIDKNDRFKFFDINLTPRFIKLTKSYFVYRCIIDITNKTHKSYQEKIYYALLKRLKISGDFKSDEKKEKLFQSKNIKQLIYTILH